DIDDLQAVAAQATAQRRGEIPAAERIVSEEVDRFWGWYDALGVVPVIRAFRDRLDDLRRAELERALRRLGHLSPEDRAQVDEVTVLDDLSTGRRENLPRGVRFVLGDIRSAEARDLVAQGRFDLLNHHAAQMDVRRSVADPLFDLDVNLRGLLNLLEGARVGGVRRVVFASSGGVVYGDATTPPCREGAAKLPISPYGVAKLASEHYLSAYSRLYGLEAASLRSRNVYGARQSADEEAGVVAIFSRKILAGEPLTIFGDGEQTRDMVSVKDVAAANLAAS